MARIKMDTEKELILTPIKPMRFTLDEWHLNNDHRYRCGETQQELADRFIVNSNYIREKSQEIVKTNKEETEFRLKEKIQDIEYHKKELLITRKELFLEIDALVLYKERLFDTLSCLRRNGLAICEKCLIAREHRLGIDLVHDDVDRELIKECKTIKAADSTLVKILEQAQEEIRRLKAILYSLDRDLENKDNNLIIDKHNLSLKEHSLNLNFYRGKALFTPTSKLDFRRLIRYEDWDLHTKKLITEATKEGNCAKQLRCYVDEILKETINDLMDQKYLTDNAFLKRIEETKQVKTKLELQHKEIMRQANEMGLNIEQLQKAIQEKEPYMAVAHSRLGNRYQRPGLEMTNDQVERNLIKELFDIEQTVADLKVALTRAQASQRYLLKNQIQIEEDINIKTNTLKIDEVECMTLRQTITYNAY